MRIAMLAAVVFALSATAFVHAKGDDEITTGVTVAVAWPGESGARIKVEAYPILKRIVDEETDEMTVKLGKRQTYGYLKKGQRNKSFALEPGEWRLVIGPDDTSDKRNVDLTVKQSELAPVDLSLGKIIAAPRTVGGAPLHCKVEVFRGKERVFYGYTKGKRKNVVVVLFPGDLRVVFSGSDEFDNTIERSVTLSTKAPLRIPVEFGHVVCTALGIRKAKFEFFQRVKGKNVRVAYSYTKEGREAWTVHLRPGSYRVDITNEDTDRKTSQTIEVTAGAVVKVSS